MKMRTPVARRLFNTWLDWLSTAMDKCNQISRLVIDTTGSLGNLGNSVINTHSILGLFPWTDNFNGAICSLIIIGPQYDTSKIVFHCYERPDEEGFDFRVMVPPGQYIAALPNLSDLSKSWTIKHVNVQQPEMVVSAGRTDYHNLFTCITVGEG